MSERRIDLTIMDGELFDAHQHEHGDREGDGPFVNLSVGTISGFAVPNRRGWSINAKGWRVTVMVDPIDPASQPARAPATASRQHYGHER